MRRWVRLLTGAVVAASMALPAVAAADDPLFVEWTSLAPSLSPGLDPDSDNLCKKGHEACVHSVIQEMTRRFNPLADECNHDALFALTYLRTTEEYHRFWHEGHFADPAWLNHYDAVFGDYYFLAFDDWHKGRTSVPPAWRIAFEAADAKRVTSLGNLYLGMNAHINRDLPFVLHSIGLAAPDGSSRKADHDRVNEFLNRVSDQLFAELARRFDPTVDDGNVPGTTLDDLATFQVVPAWREQAWRNAERLANAATEAERAQVAQEIEQSAALEAQTFVAQNSYNALSSFTAADRDAYCAIHHWD